MQLSIKAVRLVGEGVTQINFACVAKNKIVEVMRARAGCGETLKQFAMGVEIDEL